jgi:sugar lactone lactonase YvrE
MPEQQRVTMDLDAVGFIGHGLVRPECVLAHASGLLFASDWSGPGGVAVVTPAGGVERILARDRSLRPNGICLEPGGSFLVAHLGADDGGVWRLMPDGSTEAVLTALAGQNLPPTNFVYRDSEERVWITVSTRQHPRDRAYRRDGGDGFIVLLTRSGARIVADGLGYTNECLFDDRSGRLYVNETFARRLTSFAVAADGSLSDRRVVAEFGAGTFPDGLCLDCEGGFWITGVVSNRVIRVAQDGTQMLFLEDSDADHLASVEAAYQSGGLGRPHLDTLKARRLGNISSLAFGGADLATGYLGCLLGDSIAMMPMPLPGQKPPHWDVPLGKLNDLFATQPQTIGDADANHQ